MVILVEQLVVECLLNAATLKGFSLEKFGGGGGFFGLPLHVVGMYYQVHMSHLFFEEGALDSVAEVAIVTKSEQPSDQQGHTVYIRGTKKTFKGRYSVRAWQY